MRRLILSVALLLAVAGSAFAITRFVAGGGSSGTSAETDPLQKAQEEISLDWRKPRFEGELGPFMVVTDGNQIPVACPEPLSEKYLGPEDGEMYFVLPDGTTPLGTLCADGTVLNSGWSYRITEPSSIHVLKVRFLERPYFVVEAPRERLELTTISGRPAIVLHPAQTVFPDYKVAIMQKRGIVLELTGLADLREILQVAEYILAQGGE